MAKRGYFTNNFEISQILKKGPILPCLNDERFFSDKKGLKLFFRLPPLNSISVLHNNDPSNKL
jgi:hypothetical protein